MNEDLITFVMADNMGITKGRIEFLWSIMGGLFFSIVGSFKTCSGCYFFTIDTWLRSDKWNGFGYYYYLDEFIVGFIFTFILIKSIKKYNSLK